MIRLLPFLTLFSACAGPALNLSKPLCLVTDRDSNLKSITKLGADIWQKDLPNMPNAVVVNNSTICQENPPIFVRQVFKPEQAAATTFWHTWGWEIQINRSAGGFRPSVMTHELGHVFCGRNHIYQRESILNEYLTVKRLTSEDRDMICKCHPEACRR